MEDKQDKNLLESAELEKETLVTEENSVSSGIVYTFHEIVSIGLVCNSGTQVLMKR